VKPVARAPLIQCDKELYIKIATTLQHAITGKSVLAGDSLVELVDRHCPEIYDIAAEAGFRFEPNTDPAFLEQSPPQVWFDVVRDRAVRLSKPH
jgi:hypothetical protein